MPRRIIFNRNEFMSRLSHDEWLAKSIITEFLSDIPKRLQELKKASAKKDLASVTIHAHSIRGAASYLSAERFMSFAAELENAAQKANWELIARKNGSLAKSFNHLKNKLILEFCE